MIIEINLFISLGKLHWEYDFTDIAGLNCSRKLFICEIIHLSTCKFIVTIQICVSYSMSELFKISFPLHSINYSNVMISKNNTLLLDLANGGNLSDSTQSGQPGVVTVDGVVPCGMWSMFS